MLAVILVRFTASKAAGSTFNLNGKDEKKFRSKQKKPFQPSRWKGLNLGYIQKLVPAVTAAQLRRN